MALGTEGARESGVAWCDTAGPGGQHEHVPPQLRPTPVDERYPDKLSQSVAGALFDTDDADLPGACAGPVWEPGGSA